MCRDPFHFPFLRKNIRNSFFIFFLDKREKNCYTIDMYEKKRRPASHPVRGRLFLFS